MEPNLESQEGQVGNGQQEAPAQPQANDPQPQVTPLQARINQLVRRANEAERTEAEVSRVNRQLTDQLTTLNNKIEALELRGAATPPASLDPWSSPEEVHNTVNNPRGQELRSMMKEVVAEAIAPIQKAQEQQKLEVLQQQSFDGAAEFYPDIAIDGSPAQTLFNKIWNETPELSLMPNGPAFAINAVAGVLGNLPRQQSPQEARKSAMSSPAPATPHQRLQSLPNQDNLNERLVNQLAEKGRESGLQDDELTSLLAVKLGRANAVPDR